MIPDSEMCPAVRSCLSTLQSGGECDPVLPVLKRSVLPQIPAGSFSLTPLRTGVWAYQDVADNSLMLKMGTRLALLDLPDETSAKPDGSMTVLTDAAEQILNGTVPTRIDIVYSHAHLDHIGGTTRFYNYMREVYPKARIFIWGTKETKTLIQNSVTNRAIVPNIIVGKAGRTFSLGDGLEVQMNIIGGHTADDLILYIPRHKTEASILMYVDVVFPKWSPPYDLAMTTDVGRYISAQREILQKEFDVFVGGHLLLGNKNDVRENLRFSEDLVLAAQNGVASVTNETLVEAGVLKVFDPMAPEFGNTWHLVKNVRRKVEIDTCYRIMLQKWGCRLAAVDIFGRGLCCTAIQYLLLDY